MFFNPKKPGEFEGEMPTTTRDEEEEGYDDDAYAEGDEYEEDYDDEDDGAAAPKKDWVRTALMGTAAVLVLAGGAYYALLTFAPDTVNGLVNNLPFIHHDDATASADPNAPATPKKAAAAGGEVAPAPDVTSSSDVAAVPPVPGNDAAPKPKSLKPHHQAAKVAAAPPATEGAPPASEGAPPAQKPIAKAAKIPKPAAKPAHRALAAPVVESPVVRAAGKPRLAAKAGAAKHGVKAMTPWRKAYLARAWRTRHVSAARMRLARAGAWTYPRAYAMRGRLGRYRARPYGYAVPWRAPVAPMATHAGRYAVQVGSFSDTANAAVLATQLRSRGIPAYVSGGGSSGGGAGFMVRSVAVRSPRNARRLVGQYRAAGFPARIVSSGHGLMAVEVGLYGSKAHADGVVSTLNNRGLFATVAYTRHAPPVHHGGLAHVYVGGFATRGAAAGTMSRLQRMGIPAAVTR